MKNQIMTRQQLAENMGVSPQSLNWFADRGDKSTKECVLYPLSGASLHVTPTGFACFKGVIMDAHTGKPISGAQVCLKNINNNSIEGYTNEAGEYELKTLIHGRCKVIVRRKGYESKYITAALKNGLFTFYDIMLTRK